MRTLSFLMGLVFALLVISMLCAWPFKWLWNYAVVDAISIATPIDYWVAFCLMMFISIFVASSNNKGSS